jgi:hypothetical protein
VGSGRKLTVVAVENGLVAFSILFFLKLFQSPSKPKLKLMKQESGVIPKRTQETKIGKLIQAADDSSTIIPCWHRMRHGLSGVSPLSCLGIFCGFAVVLVRTGCMMWSSAGLEFGLGNFDLSFLVVEGAMFF